MKRVLSILAIVVLSAGMLRADDVKPVNTQGNWALLFSFQGLTTISPIGGMFTINFPAIANVPVPIPATGAGMRYFLSNNMALRAGLGIGMINTSTKNGTPNNSDNSTGSSLIGLQGMAEFHMNGLGTVTPYLGAGIGFQLASYDVKNYNGAANTLNEDKVSTTQINILGSAGFQWFFANRMSLGGEYQLGIGLVSGSSTKTVGTTSTSSDLASSTTIGTTAYSPTLNNVFAVILSMYP